jgi:hypothetical protein
MNPKAQAVGVLAGFGLVGDFVLCQTGGFAGPCWTGPVTHSSTPWRRPVWTRPCRRPSWPISAAVSP